MNEIPKRANYPVNSLLRAIDILDLLGKRERELGLTQIAEELGLSKSTTHRLLDTLVARDYVEQNPSTSKYKLGLRLFELGNAVGRQMDLRTQARPYLERLLAISNEVVHLGIVDQGEVVYIDKVESPHVIRMYSQVGKRAPLHCTGIGKALLAFLPEGEIDRIIKWRGLTRFTPNTITDPDQLKEHLAMIRKNGYARDEEEHEEGIRCVAAPIWDHSGKVVASVSIAGPTIRMTREKADGLVGELLKASHELSRELGYVVPKAVGDS